MHNRQQFTVTFEDGTEQVVTTKFRDVLEAERAGGNAGDSPVEFGTRVAFAALSREGLVPAGMPWEAWIDTVDGLTAQGSTDPTSPAA